MCGRKYLFLALKFLLLDGMSNIAEKLVRRPGLMVIGNYSGDVTFRMVGANLEFLPKRYIRFEDEALQNKCLYKNKCKIICAK